MLQRSWDYRQMPPTPVLTILLVDDDEDALDLLGNLLVTHGYAVATAHDGQRALDYLRDNPHPCLILLDLMMPRMSGCAFLERKAHNSKLAALPVVIISGTANTPVNLDAVRKPWNIENLLNLVRKSCLAVT
jgi:CheY-like chemotaxis protein